MLDQPKCPSCGSPMRKVFLFVGGGVFLSEDRARVDSYMRFLRDGTQPCQHYVSPREPRLVCVVGAGGFRSGGEWPIPGLRCDSCRMIAFDPSACWKERRNGDAGC
jgi:hypothetical protein